MSKDKLIEWVLDLMKDPTQWESMDFGSSSLNALAFTPLIVRGKENSVDQGSFVIGMITGTFGGPCFMCTLGESRVNLCDGFPENILQWEGYIFRYRFYAIKNYLQKKIKLGIERKKVDEEKTDEVALENLMRTYKDSLWKRV